MASTLQRMFALVQSMTSTADTRDRYVLARLDQLTRALMPDSKTQGQLSLDD